MTINFAGGDDCNFFDGGCGGAKFAVSFSLTGNLPNTTGAIIQKVKFTIEARFCLDVSQGGKLKPVPRPLENEYYEAWTVDGGDITPKVNGANDFFVTCNSTPSCGTTSVKGTAAFVPGFVIKIENGKKKGPDTWETKPVGACLPCSKDPKCRYPNILPSGILPFRKAAPPGWAQIPDDDRVTHELIVTWDCCKKGCTPDKCIPPKKGDPSQPVECWIDNNINQPLL
jgi:hypothetical protein